MNVIEAISIEYIVTFIYTCHQILLESLNRGDVVPLAEMKNSDNFGRKKRNKYNSWGIYS
jgi:hypothetical protein